jgi:hypothetical protein
MLPQPPLRGKSCFHSPTNVDLTIPWKASWLKAGVASHHHFPCFVMIATISCFYHHHSLLFTTSLPRSTHHSRIRKKNQH